jgi:uncharacterized protein YcsI (UPF0317 family)
MLNIQDPNEARKIIRNNQYDKQTAGIASRYVQGNVCILPSKYSANFETFCKLNPKPCPLIGLGDKGDPKLENLGNIDIRTDVPKYRVWEKGEIVDEPLDKIYIMKNVANYYSEALVFHDHSYPLTLL